MRRSGEYFGMSVTVKGENYESETLMNTTLRLAEKREVNTANFIRAT
jgi:hypothetical protein